MANKRARGRVTLPNVVRTVPAKAYDISGRRFGTLIALKPLSRCQLGIVWWCACDCGGHAKRTAAALLRAERVGKQPCCSSCLDELNSGRFADRRNVFHDIFVRRIERGDTLYTDRELERIEDDISSAIQEYLPSNRLTSLSERRYKPDPGYFDPDAVRKFNRRVNSEKNVAKRHSDPLLHAQLETMLARALEESAA